MAILKFKPYSGGPIHVERTNDYITNGHGDEVLVRTNRYITGDHAVGNRCVGVNCPSDPELATAFMDSLRVQYENNLGGRKTKGARTENEGAAHYQLIVSWDTSESVSPKKRIEIMQELIQNTRLKNHAHLLAPHDNKDDDHIHDSVSAFSLDGKSKLCMNNEFLYELRRELDRICVAHGYSIVATPELWGDENYKEWVDCVQDLEVVPVHAPRPKSKKKTQKEQYADAKKKEREEEERLRKELAERRHITPETRGTDFYSLPHVYDPNDPEQQLYTYALDPETGERRSPLELDALLQHMWAMVCSEKLEKMPSFAGKRALAARLHWAEESALAAYLLLKKLDIGTHSELEVHLKAVGGEISKYRQEVARQDKVLATATEEGNTAKLERAKARKEKAEEKLRQRKTEYRELKHAEGVLKSMDSASHWKEFSEAIMEKSIKPIHATEAAERMIRENYYDIAQLLGLTREDVDRMMEEALAADPEAIVDKWVVLSGELRITYARRANGMTAMYDCIRDDYADRRALWEKQRQLSNVPVVGPLTLMLHVATLVMQYKKQEALEEHIAKTKRLAEDIQRHNKISQKQFKTAKTLLALQLINATEEQAQSAWKEFDGECERIIKETDKLRKKEAEYLKGKTDHTSSVNSIEPQYHDLKKLKQEKEEPTR